MTLPSVEETFDRVERTKVTLPLKDLNLSVNVGQDIEAKITGLIRGNCKITKREIAELLGVSEKTIEREMKKIKNIHFVGSGFSGHWEIED